MIWDQVEFINHQNDFGEDEESARDVMNVSRREEWCLDVEAECASLSCFGCLIRSRVRLGMRFGLG